MVAAESVSVRRNGLYAEVEASTRDPTAAKAEGIKGNATIRWATYAATCRAADSFI